MKNHLLAQGLISPDDLHLFRVAPSVEEGVREIARFYHHFRSYRWVGERMVIRLERRLSAKAVAALNADFPDILHGSEIRQGDALPEEKNEPELAALPRLIFTPHRRNFGRLRVLIDAINAAELDES